MSDEALATTTRMAVETDMTAIYMMGFDVWGEGDSQRAYLESCSLSPKYKRGQWYVLEGPQGNMVSSLITYSLGHETAGIGSIASSPELRRRGFATRLIKDVLLLLKQSGVTTVFLFSDISPEFYEKFGFTKLPDEFQRYQNSSCMVWGTPLTEVLARPGFTAPSYF